MQIESPPHNIGAEQGLIGAVLLDNRLHEHVADIQPDHFFDPLHEQLWRLICDVLAGNGRADPVTLRPHIKEWRLIGDMTPYAYLGHLAANGCSAASLGAYAAEVRRMALRRRVAVLATDAAGQALDVSTGDKFEADMRAVIANLEALLREGARSRELAFAQAFDEAMKQADAAYERQGGLAGLPTGLSDLDRKMGGLQKSDLIVLAGRPAMGKTAMAANIAVTTARGAGHDPRTGESYRPRHVHFFSQEMSAVQLALRVISELTEVPSDKLRRGEVTEGQITSIHRRREELSRLPMTIDETGGITLSALAQKARRIKRRYDTGLIIVDYLQLMSGGSGNQNRVQEITAITTGLKALAKELDVPIIALSQLSRRVEERSDKRPQLSDLRESGSIEQDADVVLFVYRDDYYLSREEPDDTDFEAHLKWEERIRNATGKAEVIIAKHRHAPTGLVELSFQAELTRFGNLAREQVHG